MPLKKLKGLRDGAGIKAERVQYIHELVTQSKDGIDEKTICAHMFYHVGLNYDTSERYIENLIDMCFIHREGYLLKDGPPQESVSV